VTEKLLLQGVGRWSLLKIWVHLLLRWMC